jgi:hypothetical protein
MTLRTLPVIETGIIRLSIWLLAWLDSIVRRPVGMILSTLPVIEAGIIRLSIWLLAWLDSVVRRPFRVVT